MLLCKVGGKQQLVKVKLSLTLYELTVSSYITIHHLLGDNIVISIIRSKSTIFSSEL